jgi:hypothetical protein
MAFIIERSKANERMHQVRTLLSFIKEHESKNTPPIDADDIKIVRGLFYVGLYGAFEKTINEAVEQYIRGVGTLKIQFSELNWGFLPTALDPIFTSLKAGGKWEKRIELFDSLQSEDICSISDTVFSDQLQNTWFEKLQKIANCIGVRDNFLRNGRDAIYVDEVVDKRNQVAHGRNTPLAIGSLGRSTELGVRFDAISRVIDDYLNMLENNYNSLDFVKSEYRQKYIENDFVS